MQKRAWYGQLGVYALYSFSGGEWQGHVLVQLWDEWTPVKGPRCFPGYGLLLRCYCK